MTKTADHPAARQHCGRVHSLEKLLRLVRVLWQRKHFVLAALAASLLAGGVYYFTTPHSYQARAALLVTPVGPLGGQIIDGRALATYEQLFRSSAVLEGALKRVQEMPAAARVDFAGKSRDAWDDVLAERLATATLNGSAMITVSYQSQSPEAAVLLLEAIVGAFLEFIQRQHKDATAETITTLHRERLGIELRLQQKRQALAAARVRQREEGFRDEHTAELQLLELDLQRLSGWHESLVSRSLDVEIHQHHPPVRFDVVSPAHADDRPVWPRSAVITLIACIGGLAIGLGIVFSLDLADDRFRSPEELRNQIGAPVLAMIGQLSVCEGAGPTALQVYAAPHALESEAFRTLRAALAFAGNKLSSLAITSAHAGDGKTTVLANLAVAVAQAGKRTLLIDADLRRGGLSRLLNVRGAAGLSNVLGGSDDVGDIATKIIHSSGIERLDVLACGPRPSHPAEMVCNERMLQLIAWSKERYDHVLVDCPPLSATSDAAVVGGIVEGMILVVQPEVNNRRSVLRAAMQIADLSVRLVGIVANRVRDSRSGGLFAGVGGYAYNYGEIFDDDRSDDEVESRPASGKPDTRHLPSPAPAEELRPRRVA